MDPARRFLMPEDEIFMVNPFDEVAVEMGLRFKQSLGQGEVILLTLGPVIAESGLRRCLGMGADRLVHIEADQDMDPWRKSFFLSRAIREIGAGLVLCGKESLDRQSGQVGAYLAHRLGMPFVSAMVSGTVNPRTGTVEAERRAGRGVREVMTCALPAVLSVDMGLEVRLPKFEDRRRAESVRFETLVYTSEAERSRTRVAKVFTPIPRPKKVFTPDSRLDAFERIQQLLMGSRVEKKGSLLTASVEAQVDGILSFLTKHGFLGKEKGQRFDKEQ
ncbi:MAG: electron transfer flavoprotein subunit beta/FixA family protein [Deltaproteobacteria bacterium]